MEVPDHYRERARSLMVAYVFDKIIAQGVRAGQVPARTDQARRWFRNKARGTTANASRLISSGDNYDSSPSTGSMYLFSYDPKHKRTLPYYDRFPLIFMVGGAEGGFTGINMHYLSLTQRAILMDALYDTVNNQRYDDSTKLRISYQILSNTARFKAFKPTFKRYLGSQVRSRFLKIDPVEWDIALFLPLQRFEKASAAKVHRDSIGAV